MGKTSTPKYRLIVDNEMMIWQKEYGRPTEKNLQKFILAYAKSFESGGVNVHISHAKGYIPYPSKARIESNLIPTWQEQKPVAEWKAGMFQVW